MKPTLIFENALYDQFEQQILSGKISNDTIMEMFKNNRLDERQLKIVMELMPQTGSKLNTIKQANPAAGAALQQRGKNVSIPAAARQQQAKQQPQQQQQTGQQPQANQQKQTQNTAIRQHWANINKIATSQFQPALNGLKMATQDADIQNAVDSINEWLYYTEGLLKKKIAGR